MGKKLAFQLIGCLFGLIFLNHPRALAQRYIYGDFTGGNWNACGSSGAMSTNAGTSYYYATSGVGTATKYFRLGDNTGLNLDPGVANAAVISGENTTYRSGQACGSGNSWTINANSSYTYIFKTAAATTVDFIVFEVQTTTLRTLGVPTQSPVAASVVAGGAVTVTSTLSGALSAGQTPYIRYATVSNFATSTVASMSVAGTTATGTIPAGTNTAGTTVYYYIFMSGDGGTLSPIPPSNGTSADLYSQSAQGSTASPYSYTVPTPATITSNATGNWNTGGTWVGGIIPSSADNVIIANGHTVTLDATKSCGSLTINAGGIYSGSTNTLTIAAAGNLTNNGTFTCGTGTISFAGASTISGTISFKNVTIAGAVNFGTASTITGNLTINSGGSVLTNAPIYSCPSTLIINTGGTFSRSTAWGAVTSGAGYPCNLQISNSTTYDVGGSGAANTAQIGGNLTIDNSCTFTLDGTTKRTAVVTIVGNVIVGGGSSGTMTLSTSSGGDLAIGGNLTRGISSTWTNNSRNVTFNGSVTQTISYTGGGTQYFDYLIINKSANNLVLSSSPATNVQIQTSSNDVITINNTGGLDINGQTFTLGCVGGCNGGNIKVDGTGGTAKSIISSIANGVFRIQGNATSVLNKTVTTANSGTLNFSTGTILAINNCDFNPGASLTTVSYEADIEPGGDFKTNAPIYSSSPASTLKFKNGNNFNLTVASTPQMAWVPGPSGPGVPWNVYILGIASSGVNTEVTMQNGNGGQNGFYVRNDLTLEGVVATTGMGVLTLSNTNGPNTLYLGGNYTQLVQTSINENNQKVVFYGGPNGNNDQTIDNTLDADPNGLALWDAEINQANATTTNGSVIIRTGVTNNLLTIENSLTLTKGYLVLNEQLLVINATATHSGASTSSFVVTNYTSGTTKLGCMKKLSIGSAVNFTFPIGPSKTSYNPVIFEAAAGNVSDDYYARVLTGVAPTSSGYSTSIAVGNTAPFVNRTWELYEGTAGGTNGDVTFQWVTADENASFTRASDQVYHYSSGWVNIPANIRSNAGSPYTVRAGAVTSFSPYIVGSTPPVALPIELTCFSMKSSSDGNRFDWTTASEVNNDFFTLEASTDGINFTEIHSQKGAGNSSQYLNYSYLETSPLETNNKTIYYRLKQTDFDGKFSYSQIISNRPSSKSKLTINSLFVDATKKLNLNLNNNENVPLTIEITDALGRVLLYQKSKYFNGSTKLNLPENDAQQILILKIYSDSESIVRNFFY